MTFHSIGFHVANDPIDSDWKRLARDAAKAKATQTWDDPRIRLKIESIKAFRMLHGGSDCSLKDAKETVEEYMRLINPDNTVEVDIVPLSDTVSLRITTRPEGYKVERIEVLPDFYTEKELRRLIVKHTQNA